MFDRGKFKSAAKAQLKGNYKVALIASLVICFINFMLTLPNNLLIKNEIVSMIFSICTTIISLVLSFAFIYLCMNIVNKSDSISFSTFTDGLALYKPAILAGLWQGLFIFLWSFLFLIPFFILFATITINNLNFNFMSMSQSEILNSFFLENFSNFLILFLLFIVAFIFITIKSLQYSFMNYLVIDNNGKSIRKSLRLSIELTKGHKGNLFVLGLSFIGWILLALLIPFVFALILKNENQLLLNLITQVSIAFLQPYIVLTHINAYYYIKTEALEKGNIKQEDLN